MKTRISLIALTLFSFAALAPAFTTPSTLRSMPLDVRAPITSSAPLDDTFALRFQDTAQAKPSMVASALNRLGGTFVYDPTKGSIIAAVTYEIEKLEGFAGSKVDLSLAGLVGANRDGLALGFAALYQRDVKLTVSKSLKGVASLTAGPALLYGADGGKLHLGAVAGIKFGF